MNSIIDKINRKAELQRELQQIEEELSEVNVVGNISELADSISVKDSVDKMQANLGISLEELAEGLGITRKTLYDWINERNPSRSTRLGLYFLSTLSIHSLIGWTDAIRKEDSNE